MKTIQLFANGEQFDYTPENGKIDHPCGFLTSWTRPNGLSVSIHDSASGLTSEMVESVKRYHTRALTLADAMAGALDTLGEPFPLVRDCVRAGQAPQALIDSMRVRLADLMHEDAMDWILSCDWPDVDDYEIRNLSDLECLAAIECHYQGGILAFAVAMDH